MRIGNQVIGTVGIPARTKSGQPIRSINSMHGNIVNVNSIRRHNSTRAHASDCIQYQYNKRPIHWSRFFQLENCKSVISGLVLIWLCSSRKTGTLRLERILIIFIRIIVLTKDFRGWEIWLTHSKLQVTDMSWNLQGWSNKQHRCYRSVKSFTCST